MNKIIKEQVMTNKWHEFLYGYSTGERTEFLKSMEEDYPIVYKEDAPIGIYLEPYGISHLKEREKRIDREELIRLEITAQEYLKNLIAYHIINRIENNSLVMEKIEPEIIEFLNSDSFLREDKVSSVKDYMNELKDTLDICKQTYNSLLLRGEPHPKMYEFPSDFIDIEQFGKNIKRILNNNGQFNIIVDYRNPIVLESANAIMSIVNSRCAGTICMKIATDMEKWPTYTDLNGRFVEHIHDYSIVELDDSYRKTLDKRIARFRNK